MSMQANTSDLTNMPTAVAGLIEANAHRRLKKEFAENLAPHDITTMEWFALGYLYEQRDGVPLSAMAVDMQTSLPYLTVLINTMADKRLVERVSHANDNRIKLIQLLPSANELYVSVEQNLQSKFNDFAFKKIPQSDLAAYMRVVRKLSSKK